MGFSVCLQWSRTWGMNSTPKVENGASWTFPTDLNFLGRRYERNIVRVQIGCVLCTGLGISTNQQKVIETPLSK